MKKILALVLTLVAGFVLIACDNTEKDPDPDNTEATAPVLHGVEAVDINVGDAFDPKAGVTATDEKDGDLTAAIVIEGTVNVNKAGEYELIYTVTNSSDLTDMKRRVVNVIGIAGLVNGDFSDGLNGWTQWYDSSKAYEVEYSAADGKAVIDVAEVDETDGQWWGIQLSYKALQLTKFESYTLKFTVSAENERYMNYQIQGGGIPGGKAFGEKNLVTINETEQTIEKDFFVKDDAVDAELQFAFGNFTKDMYNDTIDEAKGKVAGKIYISNVQIVAGPELQNQAPEISAPDVVLEVGTEEFLIMQGVSVSDDRDMLTVADLTYTDITEDGEFTLPAVAGVYQIEYKVTDSEGLETKVVRTITVASPWNGEQDMTLTEYGLDWSVRETATGWYVRDIETTEENKRLEVTTEDGVTSVKVNEVAPDDWRVGYGVAKLQLFPGTYTITFEAKADEARLVRLAIEGANLENGYIDQQITTDWTTITIVYEIESFQANKIFEFWFGSLTTDRPGAPAQDASQDILTTVHFRNFEVNFEK